MGVTARFVEWLADGGGKLPTDVVDRAKLLVTDSVGVAVAGRDEPGVRALIDTIGHAPPGDGVPVLCHGTETDASSAALVGGTMVHSLDFDDTLLPSRLHASGGLTMGLLALGHLWELSGSDVIRGFAAGFEVAARLADAIHPRAYESGWHNTGVLTPLAVAAAGLVMVEAGRDELEHALGMAASQAGGLLYNRGSMTKALHAGRGAEAGVRSALLARGGFTARPAVLDDDGGGFVKLFGGESGVRTDDLGSAWSLLRTGIKPYACGFVAHAAVDATVGMYPEIDPARVGKLRLDVPSETLELMGDAAPANGLEAKFSLPFVVAAGLVHGHVGPALFQDAVIADPLIQHVMAVTEVVVDDELTQDQARIHVVEGDGERTQFVEAARGSIGNPMDWDDVLAKFRPLIDGAVGNGLEEALINFESRRVRDVTTLLSGRTHNQGGGRLSGEHRDR